MKKNILFIGIGVIIGAAIAYGVIQYLVVQRAKAEVARLVDDTPAVEAVKYDRIQVGLIRSTLTMKDIQLKLSGYQEPIQIDQVDLMVPEFNHDIPPHARAEIKGIHLSTRHGLFDPVRTELETMGYRNMDGLIALSYHYSAADKRLDLDQVTLEAEQMGRLRLELTLTDMDLNQLMAKNTQPNIATLLMTMPMVSVAGGRLSYSDDSFLQRLLHTSEQNPSDYQIKLKENLKQLLNGTKKESTRQVFSGLTDFIDRPESLTITLNPPRPVPFIRLLWMKKPADLLEILNLNVTS